MIKKFVSPILMIALVVMTSGILVLNPSIAMAASLSAMKDTLSRQKASTVSDHTIQFTSTSGIANSGTVTLVFDNSTSTTGVVYTDIDVSVAGLDKTVVAGSSPGATEWGFVNTSSTTLTFTLGSGAAVTAAQQVIIEIGLNATYGASGTHQMTNGGAGTSTLTITAGTDSGIISMPITDNDQVTMSASVAETITFDLDTAITDTESATPYTVNLGQLLYTQVNRSDHSAINSIYMDAATNATGGMTVTVQNANGSDGLKSTSVAADKIVNAAAVMSAGTANYGLCVVSGPTGGLARAGTYNSGGTCTTASATNEVEALTTTPLPLIASTAASTAAGRAEVLVNATVASSTPAHADYADTLTFIATASF